MKHLNPLHRLIREATGATAGDVANIENIMREEIFHSTLDWQTREQLMDGARQAMARLNDNRELYEYGRARALATFQEIRTSSVRRPPSPQTGEGAPGSTTN